MQIGLIPTGHTFDFLHPSLTREFSVLEDTVLVMEFNLLVKGATSKGFFALLLKLDPGFDIYIGDVKVFNFVEHGINNEVRKVMSFPCHLIANARNGINTG